MHRKIESEDFSNEEQVSEEIPLENHAEEHLAASPGEPISRRKALGKMLAGLAAGEVILNSGKKSEAGDKLLIQELSIEIGIYPIEETRKGLERSVFNEYNVSDNYRKYFNEQMKPMEERLAEIRQKLKKNNNDGIYDEELIKQGGLLLNQFRNISRAITPEEIGGKKITKEMVEKRILDWVLENEADKVARMQEHRFPIGNINSSEKVRIAKNALRDYGSSILSNDVDRIEYDLSANYKFPVNKDSIKKAIFKAFGKYRDKIDDVEKILRKK